MKKLLQTLTLLSVRYVSIDDFKNALQQADAQDASQGKISKKKKRYSFKNPDNLRQVMDEPLLPIPGGGLRPLLQEFEIVSNYLINSRIAKVKRL